MSGKSTESAWKETFLCLPKSDTNPLTALTIQRFLVVLTRSSLLIMIVVIQIPTILCHNGKPSGSTTAPSFSGNDSKTFALTTDGETVARELCSEIYSLVNQKDLYYNACLTSSLPLLQSVNAFSSVFDDKQCNNSLLPFISIAAYMLCRNNRSLVVILQEKCVEIHDYDCAIEWITLESVFDGILTDCSSFTVGSTNVTFSKPLPHIFPDKFIAFYDIYLLSLLGGAFVLIAYYLQRKKKLEMKLKKGQKTFQMQQISQKKVIKTKNEASNAHHHLMQQSDFLNSELVDKETTQNTTAYKENTMKKLQEASDMHKVEIKDVKDSLSPQLNVEQGDADDEAIVDVKNSLSPELNVEQASMEQGVADDEAIEVIKLNEQNKLKDGEWLVRINDELTLGPDHYFPIVPQNCEEECNNHLQFEYMEMNASPSVKKETLTAQIARTYDEERACRIHMIRIAEWRKIASSEVKPPKNNFTGKTKNVASEIKKKLSVKKSPEEEICRIGIKKCLHNRDQLIKCLYKQKT